MHRRIATVAAAGLLLLGAGVAVAHSNNKSIKAVGAEFTATTASKVSTSTCTGPDGTYERTRATYTGTAASSEASLNGPVRIDSTSLINTTTGYGVVEGKLRIDASDGKRSTAHFTTVYTGGSTVGLATGHTSVPATQLVANMSADYSAAGGFANGKLGGGTGGGNAVVLSRGGCRPTTATTKPEHVTARGKITAVSSTSISVAGVTCDVPSNLQDKVGGLKTDDLVSIKCDVANGATTLTRVSGWHSKKHD